MNSELSSGHTLSLQSVNKVSFSQNDADRSVLFLDIDGVIQPDQSIHGYRFKIQGKDKEVYSDIVAQRTGISHLRKLAWYDVAAVDLDWEEDALSNLREILTGCRKNIEIVLSSSWRETKSLEDMKALFAIHGLDAYLTDMCPLENFCSKTRAIELYLQAHPALKDYVIVDDENLLSAFPGQAVYCDDSFLTSRIRNQVLRIFRRDFWWEHYSPARGDYYVDGFENVIFLDIDGVLNAENMEGPMIDETMVSRLARIVSDRSCRYRRKAEIVLSSSWRFSLRNWALDGFTDHSHYSDCHLLMTTLARYGLRIADMTPWMLSGPQGRPLEIRTWLTSHPDVRNYVILDDDSFWTWEEQDLEKHVVRTAVLLNKYHWQRGLTEENVEQANRILRGDFQAA